jgi:O-antigen/teichoic acid export membrane protein
MASDNFSMICFLKNKIKVVCVFFGIIVLASCFFYFLINHINFFLFGNNYSQFYNLSKIFTIFILMYLPNLFLNWYLQAKKNKDALFFINLIFFPLKTILFFIFLYFWNILGAVLIYNINAIILFVLYIFVLNFYKSTNKRA